MKGNLCADQIQEINSQRNVAGNSQSHVHASYILIRAGCFKYYITIASGTVREFLHQSRMRSRLATYGATLKRASSKHHTSLGGEIRTSLGYQHKAIYHSLENHQRLEYPTPLCLSSSRAASGWAQPPRSHKARITGNNSLWPCNSTPISKPSDGQRLYNCAFHIL